MRAKIGSRQTCDVGAALGAPPPLRSTNPLTGHQHGLPTWHGLKRPVLSEAGRENPDPTTSGYPNWVKGKKMWIIIANCFPFPGIYVYHVYIYII